jgi:hypothetical protein
MDQRLEGDKRYTCRLELRRSMRKVWLHVLNKSKVQCIGGKMLATAA